MSPINYAELLRLALPQVIIVATALIVMAIDLLILRRRGTKLRFAVAATLASLGCIAAIARIVLAPAQVSLLDGMLVANPLTHLVQIALLALTIFTLLVSVDSTFTEHVGEFVLLILLATAGMMFLVSTQDLLVIFISLELLSLSLYILAAFNKRSGSVVGSRHQILPLWRNVRGIPALRIQPTLWAVELHEPCPHRRRAARALVEPAAGYRDRDHCDWPGFQDRRSAISLLGT